MVIRHPLRYQTRHEAGWLRDKQFTHPLNSETKEKKHTMKNIHEVIKKLLKELKFVQILK